MTDSAGKLGRDVTFNVEYAIIEKFIGNFNKGTKFICTERSLTESFVAFGKELFLIKPICRAVRSYDRDFSVTA